MNRSALHRCFTISSFCMVMLGAACLNAASAELKGEEAASPIHKGARSIRVLPGSNISIAKRFHTMDNRAWMVSVTMDLSLYMRREEDRDGTREYHSEKLRTGVGLDRISYFPSKSYIHPFWGIGIGLDYDYYETNRWEQWYNWLTPSIVGVLGGEWNVSSKVSFIAEYRIKVIYNYNRVKYRYGYDEYQTRTQQSLNVSTGMMSLGMVFYLPDKGSAIR